MPAPDDLISTTQAAEILGRPVATINRWAARGYLPVEVQAPGTRGARLYRRADVLALVTPDRSDAA